MKLNITVVTDDLIKADEKSIVENIAARFVFSQTDNKQDQPEDTKPYEETDERLIEILGQKPEYLADEYDHLTGEEREALANKN